MRIDNELQNLIPPLSPEEYATLEASCIDEGIRNPLVAWGDILIDGHTRYEIARRHHLTYKVDRIEFATREDAIVWIITNQCGRRNLSELDRVVLIEKKRSILERQAKTRMLAGKTDPTQNFAEGSNRGEVRQQLAREAGVSHPTYEALATVAKSGTDELKQATREKKIGASTAAKIATLPAQEQRDILKGTKTEIVQALKKSEEKPEDDEYQPEELPEQPEEEIPTPAPVIDESIPIWKRPHPSGLSHRMGSYTDQIIHWAEEGENGRSMNESIDMVIKYLISRKRK